MKNITRWMAIGIACSALTGITWAQGGAEHGRHRPGRGMDRLVEYLDLSSDQVEAWRDLEATQREAVRPLFEQMRTLRGELDVELDSGANPTRIGELMLAQRDLQGRIRALHEESHQARVAVLTAEQRERLEAFEAARGGRGGRHGGPGHHGRRGPQPDSGV